MGGKHKLRNYATDREAISFFNSADRLAKYIVDSTSSGDKLLVIHHNADADGNTSGLIAEEIGQMLDMDVESLGVPQISQEEIELIKKEIAEYDPKLIIFTDIGSGYKKLLDNEDFDKLDKDIIILDHHPPIGPKRKFKELNPHNYGMDGAHACSGATIAYSMAESIFDKLDDARKTRYIQKVKDEMDIPDENEVVLYRLVTAGMIGAVVDGTDPEGKVNKAIFKKAEAFDVVKMVEWPFYGYHRRTVVDSLAMESEPLIDGIIGDRSGAGEFLKNIGIKPTRHPYELSEYERKLIITELDDLIDKQPYSDKFKDYGHAVLNRKTYVIDRYAGREYGTISEFGSLITACTKHGNTPEDRAHNQELARRLLLGDESVMDEAVEVWKSYRREIARGIGKANWLVDKEYYRENHATLDGQDVMVSLSLYMRDYSPHLVGTIASYLAGNGRLQRKDAVYSKIPVLVYTYVKLGDGESYFKFSARAPEYLEVAGLDLGEAMAEAAAAAGGIGGGHNCAAGASIPREGYETFFRIYSQIVADQLKEYIRNGYQLQDYAGAYGYNDVHTGDWSEIYGIAA